MGNVPFFAKLILFRRELSSNPVKNKNDGENQFTFSMLPKSLWLVFSVCIIFNYFGNRYITVTTILINFTLAILLSKLSIFIHECGHLLFAKLAGGTPRWLILGNGDRILKFEMFNIIIILNTKFNSGGAIAVFNNTKNLYVKYILYVSGGYIINILSILLIWSLLGFNFNIFHGENGIDLATCFIFGTFLIIFTSLIPTNFSTSKISPLHDGLIIFKLIFTKDKIMNLIYGFNKLNFALDYFEQKQYHKAIEIYESCLDLYPELKNQIILNLGSIYIKLGQKEKSLTLLKEIEESIDIIDDNCLKAIFYNNLAWYYLINQDIENANHYSRMAIKLKPNDEAILDTRGSVLTQSGNYEKGILLLEDLVNVKDKVGRKLNSAVHLALAFSQTGNEKEKRKYLDYVLAHESKMDKDVSILWENLKEKILNPMEKLITE